MARSKCKSRRRQRSCLNDDAKKNVFHKDKRSQLSEKDRFRRSKKWKVFREDVAQKDQNIDYVTQKKLVKGFNVHHLDMEKDDYCNIDDIQRFVALNSGTHKVVHYLFRYWLKDKNVMKRLEEVFEKMKEFAEKKDKESQP